MKPKKQGPKQTKTGKKGFIGAWRIMKMSGWDEDYCNMEVQAYIRIENFGNGDFQFGLVRGEVSGDFRKTVDGTIFDFTWDGSDECDEASGDGWMKIKEGGTAEGEIRIHNSDSSSFWAKKVSKNRIKRNKR